MAARRIFRGTALLAAAGLSALLLTSGDDGAAGAATVGHAMPGATGTSGAAMAGPGAFAPNLDPGESNRVTRLPTLAPSRFAQTKRARFQEFQVSCTVNRVAPDDPIVWPGQPGKAHAHTFLGGRTDASTTTRSLRRAKTSCATPGDHSSYWFPTLYDSGREVRPDGPQRIYYKAGIRAYERIRPFPNGLRFLVGSPTATPAEFHRGSHTSGWSCFENTGNWDFPTACERGARLVVRYRAPSCWDGRRRDSPDHQAHMAYPAGGACPGSHPVAVPMLEYEIAYPVGADLSRLRLATGRGSTWHADFFAAWDPATQAALVTHCVNGGGQCDARGYDRAKPARGDVLDGRLRLRRPRGST